MADDVKKVTSNHGRREEEYLTEVVVELSFRMLNGQEPLLAQCRERTMSHAIKMLPYGK